MTLPESMSYYDLWKKQSHLLQTNLPVYQEPHRYKEVRFLEFPDHTLQNNRFPHHPYPRESNLYY
jgi:hypothetical protein